MSVSEADAQASQLLLSAVNTRPVQVCAHQSIQMPTASGRGLGNGGAAERQSCTRQYKFVLRGAGRKNRAGLRMHHRCAFNATLPDWSHELNVAHLLGCRAQGALFERRNIQVGIGDRRSEGLNHLGVLRAITRLLAL